jgi:hypothetical protein
MVFYAILGKYLDFQTFVHTVLLLTNFVRSIDGKSVLKSKYLPKIA